MVRLLRVPGYKLVEGQSEIRECWQKVFINIGITITIQISVPSGSLLCRGNDHSSKLKIGGHDFRTRLLA